MCAYHMRIDADFRSLLSVFEEPRRRVDIVAEGESVQGLPRALRRYWSEDEHREFGLQRGWSQLTRQSSRWQQRHRNENRRCFQIERAVLNCHLSWRHEQPFPQHMGTSIVFLGACTANTGVSPRCILSFGVCTPCSRPSDTRAFDVLNLPPQDPCQEHTCQWR